MHAAATFVDLIAEIESLSDDELVERRDQLDALRQELDNFWLAVVAEMVERYGRPATRDRLRTASQLSETEIQRALRDARAMTRSRGRS